MPSAQEPDRDGTPEVSTDADAVPIAAWELAAQLHETIGDEDSQTAAAEDLRRAWQRLDLLLGEVEQAH